MTKTHEKAIGKVHIPLNSLVGLTTLGTMKLKGELLSTKIVILIDYGATHNFISKDLVRGLGIPIIETSDFEVETGTGDSVPRGGVCKDVTLSLQELIIIKSFSPIELGSTDLVLGMQWLSKLGKMEVDWHRLEMRINLGCTTVILHEDPNLKRSSISLRAMCKTITKGYSGVLVEFRGISIEDLGAARTRCQGGSTIIGKLQ